MSRETLKATRVSLGSGLPRPPLVACSAPELPAAASILAVGPNALDPGFATICKNWGCRVGFLACAGGVGLRGGGDVFVSPAIGRVGDFEARAGKSAANSACAVAGSRFACCPSDISRVRHAARAGALMSVVRRYRELVPVLVS